MRRLIHKNPKRSIVVACVALVVAVGGTSYAASAISKNGTAGQIGTGVGATEPAGAQGTTARAGMLVTPASKSPAETPAAAGVAGAK